MAAELLACDWGTTNLRAWTLDGAGAVVEEADFPMGVSRLGPGEVARRFHDEVRPALKAEALPAVLCGMVGSNLGWTSVPYLDCPADLAALAGGLVAAPGDPTARIAPGLTGPGLAGPDVMRGEETQVFGWLAADRDRLEGRHVICHPGTHAKWILVEDGRIVRFVTFMSGELFSVLGRHSILKCEAPGEDEDAFRAGLEAAGDGGALAARLFTARSRVVAGGAAFETTPSYLSGVLIGAEVQAGPEALGAAGLPVVLLGDARLCGWYRRALAFRGVATSTHDGEAAAVAGLFALYQMEQDP
jgi:2-dehydro-3-deoxygalactonokinase